MIYRLSTAIACQLPQRLPTTHSLPTATQLTNSHFPFLLQIILVSWQFVAVILLLVVSQDRKSLTSLVIISNDDDDPVSMSELFARADPTPTTVTATAIPAAGTHKRQISEVMSRDERPNGPETTPAVPPQQEASGGFPGDPGGQYRRWHRRWRSQ
jgi:hypothetical protein